MIVCLLAVTGSSQAAIAYGADATSWGPSQLGSGSSTNNFTNGSGGTDDILFVVVRSSGTTAINGNITYNGVALTHLRTDTVADGGGTRSQAIFYLANPANGTNSLVFNPNPNNWNNKVWTAFTYGGVDNASPLGTVGFNSGTGSGSPYPLTISGYSPTSASSTTLQMHWLSTCANVASGYGVSQGSTRYNHYGNIWSNNSWGFGDWAHGSTGPHSVTQTFTGSSCGTSGRMSTAIELLASGGGGPTNTPTETPLPTATPDPAACSTGYNSDYFRGTSSSSNSFTVTGCTNQILIAVIQSENDGTPSGVAYNGDALTEVTALSRNSTNLRTEVWYLTNPDTGTHNLTIAGWSGSPVAVHIFTYCDVDQTTPIGSTSYTTATDPSQPFPIGNSLTPTYSNSTVLHMFGLSSCSQSTTQAITVGSTRASSGRGLWNQSSFGLSDYEPGATSNYSYTHTLSGGGGCGGAGQVVTAMELNSACPLGSPTMTPTHTEFISPTDSPTATLTNTPVPTLTNTPYYSPTNTAPPTSTSTHTPYYSPTTTNTPAPATPAPTATPIAVAMVKSASASVVAIGDTLTFCMDWSNDFGGAGYNLTIWDTLPIVMTYMGSDNGGDYQPRVVTWDIGPVAAGATGQVCMWGVVTGIPALPFAEPGSLLAWLAREKDFCMVPGAMLPAFNSGGRL